MMPEDIVARTFGVSRALVSDSTSNDEIAELDSLGHMNLILELESAFGVSVSPAEALAMTDMESIKRVLRKLGATW